MSRHTIPGINPDHDVVVGWDPPLQTYFAIVIDPTKDEEDEAYNPLWLGADRYEEIDRVYDLVEKVKPYANVPPEVRRQLVIDRNHDTA